jgi:hypothetical protein
MNKTLIKSTKSVEADTVSVTSSSNKFRIWFNPQGYWQTDILHAEGYLYFGSAPSLVAAMTNIAITL